MSRHRRYLSILIVSFFLSSLAVQTGAAQVLEPISEILLGHSGQGRPISAIRIGNGPRKLALIGNTHGFPERNTVALVNMLTQYFREHPERVPSSVRLYLVPTINPDGLELGTRFNGRGVDLNRNMNTNLDSCPENDWNVTVEGARGIVSDTGGPYPDSEVESRLVRSFLLDASAVIFYHSDGGDVFPSFCEHGPSIALAQYYAQASGYQYDRYWPNYQITGGMNDWAGSLGIAAIVPELWTGTEPDYEANLAAVLAVLDQADRLLPLPEPRIEQGIAVDALIWRYWKAYGGEELFGAPLAPPERFGARIRQVFQNGILEMRPDQSDTAELIKLLPLGRSVSAGSAGSAVDAAAEGLFFAETGHSLQGIFAQYWQRRGGLELFGYPLSEAYQQQNPDGSIVDMQVFERAVLIYDPANETISLAPLGWAELIRERSSAPTMAQQIR